MLPLVDAAFIAGLKSASQRLLDALIPPRCLCCGGITDSAGALCSVCWGKITFLGPPLCVRCGLPFEVAPGPEAVCGGCVARPPRYDRARAVFRYDDASRALVLRFKHADRTGSAPTFARWMARAGAELLAEAEVIVPVPLHRWRLLTRRYNQAALLALPLGRLAGLPVLPDGLSRIRYTPSQGHQGRLSRGRNVRGAFRLTRPGTVEGKRVLLIDYVLTSGATIGECVRVLRANGAAGVDVLTLARVVLDQG